ncbi:50S ribosomal protein L23 [Candidatus Enterovibrio altilux]|uniref:Large ribosomal subunit protein uL23 n=1 Tax=Candidatus Enterovibrio altilux TaxID=1927128 RepID=A0A291BA28_9GAMM|nr:50S ribosomal protein L23 [Candidatus Enterovibrio luxaltus]ATF09834.1 LSU ribosomal protein L23p (L23Ae) [Candidatus Enterovibrio luxaltus]
MITEERILKVIRAPHISEKATMATENAHTVVFKVAMTATKKEIKAAVEKLFDVEVKFVNTLITKGKTKGQGARQSRRLDVKKAYVILKEGQNINFVDGSE